MADLTDVLRSPLLAQILDLLCVAGGEWTAEELASETGAPYATITKEVRRLERSRVVAVEVIGRTKLVSADLSDPVVRALVRTVKLAADKRGGDDMAKKKKGKKKGKKK